MAATLNGRMHRRAVALLAIALATAAAMGCRGDDPGEAAAVPEQPAPAVEPPVEPAAPDAAAEVDVVLDEWTIAIDPDSAVAGPITLRIRNDGAVEHALVVRSGDEEWETEPLAPGGSVRMNLHLGAGDFDVYCPLQREGVLHADLGMYGRLRVR